MTPHKRRFLENRALRDAAKQNIKSDVEFLKSNMKDQGVGSRLAQSGADYARIMSDGATELAIENRSKLAGGAVLALAGIAAWIFREPIMQALDGFLEGSEGSADTDGHTPDIELEPSAGLTIDTETTD